MVETNLPEWEKFDARLSDDSPVGLRTLSPQRSAGEDRQTSAQTLGGLESPFLLGNAGETATETEGERRRGRGSVPRTPKLRTRYAGRPLPGGDCDCDDPANESEELEELEAEAYEDTREFEEPGIVGSDNRVLVKDTTAVPWRWICKIFIDDSRGRPVGSGTGVLISNKHVLTAAHVVYDAYQNMQQYSITVVPALDDLNEPFDRYSVSSKPKIRNEYSPGADDWDYALLTLGTAVGKKKFKALKDSPLCYWASPDCGGNTVFARLDPRTLNVRASYTAGYPGGKGGKQLWCAAGILHSADEKKRTMWTTSDTTKGQSGSPVWVTDNQRHCLVGIAIGAGTNSNVVVRVTRELTRQLRSWITEEGETASMTETEVAWELPVSLSQQPEAPSQYEEAEAYETPREERFVPPAVPKDVANAIARRDWALALKLAIQAGWRDENDLANLIFFARHPELPAEPLKPADPNFKRLSAEWSNILETEVWDAIKAAAENTDLVVSGEEVTDHHRSFFRGKAGKSLKKLIEDVAKEVDLNPGLLGTIMMAETRRPLSYLSSEKVSSYHIGCDDFFEAQAAIKARVPAFVKVKWDKKQTPVEHLNDAQTNQRLVKTIWFDSGPDGALATAVYIKFRVVRLKEIAKELGKDFDRLPLPAQFALTRMAMAAGTAGATPFLKDALNGVDIFVREAIPVRAFQTKRNATVRTAQAMHLSEWIFGIHVEPATRPGVAHEFEVMEFEETRTPVIVEHDVPRPSTRLVSVGERVELDLTSDFGANLDKVTWTIPGRFVGGYKGTVNDAQVFELTGAGLERPKISFFWVDTGSGRTVRAKIRLKSGGEKEFIAVFDVEGPSMDYFKGEPGVNRLETAHGTLGMRFGKLFDAPGIKWCWKITMPPHHAGFIKDVQTVLADRTRIQFLQPGKTATRTLVRRHPSKPNPHMQLDGDSDKEPIYTPGLSSEKREKGTSFDAGARGTSDSPITDLAALDKSVSVNDQFTYYIMFKPQTDKPQDAIWVPVAKAKWSWKGTAEQSDKKWSLGKSPKMEPGIDKTTVEFPLYESNACENEWQEVSRGVSREQYFEERGEFDSHVFESEEFTEPEMEELVPKVSGPDLRKRIDEYFDLANAEYTLRDGTKVKARPQFHMANARSEQDAETLEKLFEKHFGEKFSRPLHTVIRCAAYGRARQDEIQGITQHLIDAGELDAVSDDNPGFSNQQLVRALQRKFNIGIDCAGYVQLAFIFAFTGKRDDASCNLGSSKLRQDLGLQSKRSEENLSELAAKHFTEVGFLNGQTGDLLVLAWRKGERDWHTVIVVDHSVSDDVHTFLVDASWGFLYGADAAGIARRKLVFDKSTGKWWDIHPLDGTKVNENSIGPYRGHPIKGMYRGKPE